MRLTFDKIDLSIMKLFYHFFLSYCFFEIELLVKLVSRFRTQYSQAW